MSDLKEKGIALLKSTTSVDMKTAAKTDLFTIPSGKTCIVTHVVVRSPSATLAGAGATDYDFGTGANADTWRQTVNLTSMTAVTDYMVITGADVTKYTHSAAAAAFGVKVITGSTGANTATIDVYGYLF